MKSVHVMRCVKSCVKSLTLGTATAGVALALLAQAGATAADANDTGDAYYEVDPNWPLPLHPGTDLDFSRTGAIYAESPNRVYVFQTGEVPKSIRATPANNPDHPNWPSLGFQDAVVCGQPGVTCPANSTPIVYAKRVGPGQGKRVDVEPAQLPGSKWEHLLLVVDGKGKLIESWDQWNHLFTHPHGILIDPNDPDRHVWVIDSDSEQVFKFTHDGKKLVMALGEFRVRGDGKTHFNGPNGLAFLPNGDFYVSDGYRNTRIIKFSKDGKYISEFGKRGTGPGEFNTIHSVEVAADGRIYVGDRGNKRIQIFDPNGKYLSEMMAVYPNGLAISKDQKYLYVVQGGADSPSELRAYDLNGRLISSWGRPFGGKPGQLWGIHDFSVDSDGNLYFAQSYGGRAWKYVAKKGVTLPIGPIKKNSFER
jgi:peptidylamidoglycolate lyase